MMEYYLNAPLFFKPDTHGSLLFKFLLFLKWPRTLATVSINGTDYAKGMFVSTGQEGELPKFSRIENMLLVNNCFLFFAGSINAGTASI